MSSSSVFLAVPSQECTRLTTPLQVEKVMLATSSHEP